MTSIIIDNVSKSYADVRAVSGISIEIPGNCLFGLIGPDGAGKTTLFRLVTTLLIPDSGSVSVFGFDTVRDYRKIRLFTGYMPGRFSLYPDLTVSENLEFYATIFGTTVRKNYHIIESVYSLLEPFKDRLARNLSGGMKQKLALCCAMIHNPRILILDEPTTGVDAVSRKEFWETLQLLVNSGMTILTSTPYMDEAARCDKIAMMHSGKILIQNTPDTILTDFRPKLFEIKTTDKFRTLHVLRNLKEVNQAYLFGQSIHMAVGSGLFDEKLIFNTLGREGITDAEINEIRAGFEDCFIEASQKRPV
jgi:ABC-2 type transport system ATP-binding protein